jgi:hypothetical protein
VSEETANPCDHDTLRSEPLEAVDLKGVAACRSTKCSRILNA